MLKKDLKLSMTLLILTFILNTIAGLGFTLDAYSPRMCFILKGGDVGKQIYLDYTVLGEKNVHLHFTLFDLDSDEMLFEDKKNTKDSVEIRLDVNFLHNFEICWKNLDSEEKRINFTYKHSLDLPLEGKDVLNHLDLIEDYLDQAEDIDSMLLEENDQQVRFHTQLEDYEDDLNRLFFFKALILFY